MNPFVSPSQYSYGAAFPAAPQPGEQDRSLISEWGSLALEGVGHVAKEAGETYHQTAKELAPIADDTVQALKDLGASKSELTTVRSAFDDAIANLRSAGDTAGTLGKVLKTGGHVLTGIEAAQEAYNAYHESTGTSVLDKLVDAFAAGGAAVLTDATPWTAIADKFTDHAVSGTLRAGLAGPIRIGQGLAGDSAPAEQMARDFQEGKYGPVVKGVSDASTYVCEVGLPKVAEAVESLF